MSLFVTRARLLWAGRVDGAKTNSLSDTLHCTYHVTFFAFSHESSERHAAACIMCQIFNQFIMVACRRDMWLIQINSNSAPHTFTLNTTGAMLTTLPWRNWGKNFRYVEWTQVFAKRFQIYDLDLYQYWHLASFFYEGSIKNLFSNFGCNLCLLEGNF